MAGDWIKMRVDLASDPAVIAVAIATDLDEDHVVGKLHKLWSWADQQTENGDAPGVTEAWLDRHVGVSGFALAMLSVGWLTISSGGIAIPNFDTHNGESGKRRALTARRNRKYRDAHAVTKSAPREEKIREKSKKEKVKRENGSPQGFEEFYKAYPLHPARRDAEKAFEAAVKRLEDRTDLGTDPASWLAAKAAEYAKGPFGVGDDGKPFICYPATWLNKGRYDDEQLPLFNPPNSGPAESAKEYLDG